MWFRLQFFPSEKWQGKFKRHFIYPLLTTAVWPNLLTSRCRLGFGKTFHSSHAERQNTKHTSNNLKSFQQNTCEVYFNYSRINQQILDASVSRCSMNLSAKLIYPNIYQAHRTFIEESLYYMYSGLPSQLVSIPTALTDTARVSSCAFDGKGNNLGSPH